MEDFKVFRKVCKYYTISFDENHDPEDACHKKVPQGTSWGICSESWCPFLEKEEPQDPQIKPCPFCGNEGTVRIFRGKDGWRDRYAVFCNYNEGGCGAESGLYHYEIEAIEAWNRRVH